MSLVEVQEKLGGLCGQAGAFVVVTDRGCRFLCPARLYVEVLRQRLRAKFQIDNRAPRQGCVSVDVQVL